MPPRSPRGASVVPNAKTSPQHRPTSAPWTRCVARAQSMARRDLMLVMSISNGWRIKRRRYATPGSPMRLSRPPASSLAWGLHRRRDPPVRWESDHAPVCRPVLSLPLPTQGDEGRAERRLPVDVHACAIGSLRLESIGWIVCQPKTLTVLVPRNPLLEPPTFRADPEARRLGRGRGGSQDVGLAPVRARKDGHGG